MIYLQNNMYCFNWQILHCFYLMLWRMEFLNEPLFWRMLAFYHRHDRCRLSHALRSDEFPLKICLYFIRPSWLLISLYQTNSCCSLSFHKVYYNEYTIHSCLTYHQTSAWRNGFAFEKINDGVQEYVDILRQLFLLKITRKKQVYNAK